MSDIISNVSDSFQTGSIIFVANTKTPFPKIKSTRGIQIKSDPANTGVLWIGRSDITPGTNAGTDGYPLFPGQSILVPVEHTDNIYVLDPVGAQKAYFMVT